MGLCLLHRSIKDLERILHGGKQGVSFPRRTQSVPRESLPKKIIQNDRRVGGGRKPTEKGRGFVLPVEGLCQILNKFPRE